VLRQIHGRKASIARRWETGYLVVTVFFATVLTVIGFAGPSRVAALLPSWLLSATDAPGFVEALLNFMILVVLLLTLVGLVSRFGERANTNFRSVELLTEFIRDLTDSIALHDAGARVLQVSDVDVVRTRYKGILGALPPNTDREYLKAKALARKKRAVEPRHAFSVPAIEARRVGHLRWLSSGRQLQDVARVIRSDSARMSILQAVQRVLPDEGWVTGGFVREAVWDFLGGASVPAPIGEVDVIFMDKNDVSRDLEKAIEAALRKELKNVEWSVKNQARMHLKNGHSQYKNLFESLSRAPDTASSVALSLRGAELWVAAPLGLTDLTSLILRENPRAGAGAFDKRLAKVYRPDRWPDLLLKTTRRALS